MGKSTCAHWAEPGSRKRPSKESDMSHMRLAFALGATVGDAEATDEDTSSVSMLDVMRAHLIALSRYDVPATWSTSTCNTRTRYYELRSTGLVLDLYAARKRTEDGGEPPKSGWCA